jgi:hypothetical protein
MIATDSSKDIRAAAYYKYNRALLSGELTGPATCSRCGKGGKIHGHHADYSKPLDVEWLRAGCHVTHHAHKRRTCRGSPLSSATDLSQTVAASISHGAGNDSHTNDFFAALAMREKDARWGGGIHSR